jgi:hypothetical protein
MDKYTKEITLIHGLKDKDNKFIKNVRVRSLDGFDEDFLNEMETKDVSYPIKTSHLLSRTVIFNDDGKDEKYDENSNLDMVRNMTIGDRTYLVFLLRQLTYGDAIYFDVKCSSCNNNMSINLSTNQILNHLPSNENKMDVAMDPNRGFYQVKFSDCIANIRLLNGFDQENISSHNVDEMKLLKSCIVNIDSIGHERLLDGNFVNTINSTLSEIDPLSEIMVTLNCPSCNASSKIPFIVDDFFFKEIRSRKNNLELEVHWLALNYHWSESDILTLPVSKRRRYVELVNNTVGGE